MNIDFSIINEFCSFLIFFYFSCFFLFPKIINILNNENIIKFKNKILLKYNKILENKFFINLFYKEFYVKKQLNFLIERNNFFIKKNKNNLFKLIIVEKNFIINNIKKIMKTKNFSFLKSFIYELKILFLKSFKKIYNEIINYNNEFIINYK